MVLAVAAAGLAAGSEVGTSPTCPLDQPGGLGQLFQLAWHAQRERATASSVDAISPDTRSLVAIRVEAIAVGQFYEGDAAGVCAAR
jgi:hypothetical protein